MAQTFSIVQKWLDIARWAPSGGNAQPWLVDFDDSKNSIAIRLSIDPEYFPKHSPLDVKGSAAVLALGCLTTNLIALAAEDDYGLSDQNFHLGKDYWQSSVLLTFKKGIHCKKTYTRDEILSRHTNRSPFAKKPIPEQVRNAIFKIGQTYTKLSLFDFTTNKKSVIRELVQLEAIRWQAKSYFNSFLSEVGFSSNLEENYERNPDKIPITQLGVSKVHQSILRMLQRWPIIHNFLAHGPFFKIAAKKTLSNYDKHCDRLYFIQAKGNSFEHCFELGKAYQEIWLETHRQNIAYQPLGIPLLALGYWQKEPDLNLEPSQEQCIEEVTTNLKQHFAMDLQLPTMGFRVGYPKKETERAPRKKLFGRARSGIAKEEILHASSSIPKKT